MRRCTNCFRFHAGSPLYCVHCGRSFDVRICSRGHRNHRLSEYCAECGSADLSIAAPPASFLYRLSGLAIYLLSGLLVVIGVLVLVLGLLYSIDWQALADPLAALVVMLLFLYWTSTLLPGPVKRVGKAGGRRVMTALRDRRQK